MTDPDIVHIGEPMPTLASVLPVGATTIGVEWADGPRAGRREVIDLAPILFRLKFYRPLRDDPDLFRAVSVIRGGSAIGWGDEGDDASLDMAATTLEQLAEETMTPADFKAFLDRNGLSFDAAAAQLGVSRRLVAYYASGHAVPRYIALACRYLDQSEARHPATGASDDQARRPAFTVPDADLRIRGDQFDHA